MRDIHHGITPNLPLPSILCGDGEESPEPKGTTTTKAKQSPAEAAEGKDKKEPPAWWIKNPEIVSAWAIGGEAVVFCEGHNRSSEKKTYPRVSFTRGYTQLTRLSADERVGQLFVLAVLLQTKHGRKVLEPRFDFDFDTKRDSAKNCLAGVQSTPESEASLSSEEELGDAREGDEESSDDDQGEERYKEKKMMREILWKAVTTLAWT
jgi:hypothetical protein